MEIIKNKNNKKKLNTVEKSNKILENIDEYEEKIKNDNVKNKLINKVNELL